MRRVLQVLKELNSGGIQSVVCNLLENVDKEKVQFDFAIHWHGEKGVHEDEVMRKGARIYRFYTIRESGGIQKYRFQWEQFWEEHKNDYQVVHVHYMSHAGIILKEAKKYQKVTMVHVHSMSRHKLSLTSLYEKYINRGLLKYTDYILACSRKAGIDFFGRAFEKNSILLKNAIDTELYSYDKNMREAMRSKYQLNGCVVVGHVANCVPAKNQDFMLKIFSSFAQKEPSAILVWAGIIAKEDLIHVRMLMQKYDIEDKVILLGRCDHVNNWLQAFDVFLMPSLSEGMPVALIEAQTSGLKCIVSDVIPMEAEATELLCRCSLDESADYWADQIIDNMEYQRKDMQEVVTASGYNIHETASFMQNLYLQV